MILPSEPVQHVPYKKVIEELQAAYRDRRPWSLIRLGDGESAILGYPEFGHPSHYRNWMSNFFGPSSGEDTVYAPLKDDLERAIRGADVVGTGGARLTDPEAGRELLLSLGAIAVRTAEQNAAQNAAERLFLNYHVSRLGDLRGIVTHANIHIHLEHAGVLADLMSRSRSATLIGCRNVASALREKFPDTSLQHIAVPGEYKFEGPDSRRLWSLKKPHFPIVYHDVRAKLKAGHFCELVLVGAGPCGKVYCEDVRAAGGFALDVGSIMDLWAGVVTRSYMANMKPTTI
ncbi:hypothetical protein [Methylosinus sp. Sm6]|uniref:GT-D fold domain-containing protein n=1 Tax=Methylosinus sp. Sm6 TaxID=2866948 RepID=UPI001C9A1B27|nr:hypothetical protein [Methylosinus sp. Sm6]MBY6243483.1 hypothetical protein [Methylosinus sp. Sm6]